MGASQAIGGITQAIGGITQAIGGIVMVDIPGQGLKREAFLQMAPSYPFIITRPSGRRDPAIPLCSYWYLPSNPITNIILHISISYVKLGRFNQAHCSTKSSHPSARFNWNQPSNAGLGLSAIELTATFSLASQPHPR